MTAEALALTAKQVLGQRLLPSALSTTPFYVVTSLMRLNLGVEIASLPRARSFKVKSFHHFLTPPETLSYVSAGTGSTNWSRIFWPSSLAMLDKMNPLVKTRNGWRSDRWKVRNSSRMG